MVANVAFNPNLTTNALGSFNITSSGYIQGTALNDPSSRNYLAGGVLATTETLPMWGGVGISELISPTTGRLAALGGTVVRATTLTAGAAGLTGFSVFDQNSSMINTPQSPVPLAASGMMVNYYRIGDGARIAVAIDPVLVSLNGGSITGPVSWDFALQRLCPYVAAYASNVITASSWASTNGGQVTFTTTSAHGLTVGSDFTITGETPSAYNGTYSAIAGTTGSTLVAVLTSNPGASTVQGTLVAGGGSLNVRVLDVQVANSMVVSYDTTTGFATWNRSGSTAIILI